MPPKADSGSASRARTYASASVAAGGDAAGIRVLDDHRGRLVELERDARGRVEIEQVRERQLLALMHDGAAEPARAARDTTRRPDADSRRSAGRGSSSARRQTSGSSRRPAPRRARTSPRRRPRCTCVERRRDHLVVGGRVRERAARQIETQRQRRPVRRRQRLEHARRSRRARPRRARRGSSWRPRAPGSDRRCRSPRSRSSNGRSGVRRRLRERIEIDDHEVDRRDAVRRHGRQVVGTMPARQDAAVHLRMQGLDAAVHHLGETR